MNRLSFRLFIARTRNRGIRNWLLASAFSATQFIRCSTPCKLANLAVVKAERWLRRDRLRGHPYRFNIEPTNLCNLRCPLCPTGLQANRRKQGRMNPADYRSLVDQIAPYAYHVELYNWGEPLLHPGILEMVRYAASRKIMVGISSNLNHLDEKMAAGLVEVGLSKLLVSVDGATEESYQRYRRRGKLRAVMENLRLVVQAKRHLHSRTPFVTVRMLVNKYNETEIATLRQMVGELGVDSFTTGPLFVSISEHAQAADWLPRDASLSCYDYSQAGVANSWDCADLWEACIINWDGRVSPCCWTEDPATDFANLKETSIVEAWNNPAFVSARRVVGRGPSDPGDRGTVCHQCLGHPRYLDF